MAQELGCGNSPGTLSKKATDTTRMGGLGYEAWASSALRRSALSGLGSPAYHTMLWCDASVTIHIQTHTPPHTMGQSSCPQHDLLYQPEFDSWPVTLPSQPMPSSSPSRPHLSKGSSLPLDHSPWTLVQHLSPAPSTHSSLTRSPKVSTCSMSQLSTPALEVPSLTYPYLRPWQLLFSFIF